jgi:hypothetical protein
MVKLTSAVRAQFRTEAPRPMKASFYKWPAAADPVAVAAIHELVGTTTKSTLGSVLTRRQPRNQSWNVEISRVII